MDIAWDRTEALISTTSSNVDGTGDIDSARQALTTLTGDIRFEIDKMVRAANWTLVDRQVWTGEGATWRRAGAEVLSFLGASTYFHCIGDVPEVATSPEALEIATNVALATARRFLEA